MTFVSGMKRITSRRNAIVAQYREVAAGSGELMLLDGLHLVKDALRAGLTLRHAMVLGDGRIRPEVRRLLTALERRGIGPLLASPAVMAAVSPVRSASPIVALADRPSWPSDAAYRVECPLVMIACGIQDAGNLGAIVRVSEAGGASGVIAAGQGADPFGWKALRGSMGSALRLPTAREPDAIKAATAAKERSCRLIAAVPSHGHPLFEADLGRPIAVLLGNEGQGLSGPLLALADHRITIPMEPQVESLNAAVAAALLVYEARRQRTASVGRRLRSGAPIGA
jgi:TrmH family RNA methyltransferase